RAQPALAVTDAGDPVAMRRNLRRVSRVHAAWRASRPIHGPNCLLCARGIRRRIGHFADGVFPAATNVKNRMAIGRETDFAEFLAVVIHVGGQLTRLEFGTFGDPDVSQALCVEDPGDTVAPG